MNIKIARVKNNWTQEELSKKANVCRTTISLIEHGNIDNIKLGTFEGVIFYE